MQTSSSSYRRTEIRFTRWLARHGLVILRISLGIIYFWFGFLKFFPGLSPAQTLAGKTIETLSFSLLKPEVSVLILATWECLIGLGLFVGRFMRITLALLWLQMLGTITPLFLFPNEAFTKVPYAPTLEGQYIIKNLVLISASLILAATVRGGAIVADPEAVERASSLGETGDQ